MLLLQFHVWYFLLPVGLSVVLSLGYWLLYCKTAKRHSNQQLTSVPLQDLQTLHRLECLVVVQHPHQWSVLSSATHTTLVVDESHSCVLYQLAAGSSKFNTLYNALGSLFVTSCILTRSPNGRGTSRAVAACADPDRLDEQWKEMSTKTLLNTHLSVHRPSVANQDEESVVSSAASVLYHEASSEVAFRFMHNSSTAKLLRSLRPHVSFTMRVELP